jgi:hypothetical protein
LSLQLFAVQPRAEQQVHGAGAPVRRCSRCGDPVEGTRHTRTGWAVGHYVLHTGRTETGTLRRDDESVMTYRRLVCAVEVVACAACYATPAVRQEWATFGETEAS